MICHVCLKGATGQCKTCAKFYCPEHGDGYCTACQDAAAYGSGVLGKDAATSEEDALRREVFVSAGGRCYGCRQPAVAQCDTCGRHFCARHGISRPSDWNPFDSTRKLICSACTADRQVMGCAVGYLLVVLVFMIFGIFMAIHR
jgi:hypothetical protein